MKLTELLKSKKDIVVGYLGGSITEGDKYRKNVNSWLKESFTNNDFSEINAGVGGTTSFLGVYRSERDMIDKKPDIAIIEFSVNDLSTDADFDHSVFERSTEGIVRKILRTKPDTLILFLGLTTQYANETYYDKNLIPLSVIAHEKIASYYNIPYLNAGKYLYEHIKKTGEDVREYLSDGCHPNDKGGKFYADIINDFIKDYHWKINTQKKPCSEINLENAQLFMAENYANDEWKVSKCSLYGKLPNYIYAYKPGAEIKLDFYGSAFGIYCTTEKDSGILEYSIDGGEWIERTTWDEYCLQFNRAHNYLFTSGLEKKKHEIKIRVSQKKDELSEGHYIRIGAFLCETER